MITERATVISCANGFAEVQTERRTSCSSCSAKSGCGTSLVESLFKRRASQLRVANPLDAQPGDQVTIGLEDGLVQRAALLLYAVPLMGLIGGAIFGDAVQHSELASILFGLLGLGAGLLVVRVVTQQTRLDASQACILRIERSSSVLCAALQTPISHRYP